MTRALNTDLKDEVIKPRLAPIFLTEFLFDSQTLRFWNGIGNLTWNGNIFTGAATLIGASEISETQDTQAQGIRFTLNGLPTTLVSLALQENYTGRVAILYFACLDENNQLVGEPYPIFSGKMDVMEIEDSGETASITLSVESKMLELKKAKVSRFTSEDQKRRYPDDKGFDFVPSLQDKEIVWGKATPAR